MDPKEIAIRANELRKEKKYKEALENYRQSWDVLKAAYTGAGLLHCLRKLEDFEHAVSFAERLINLFPKIDWVKIEVAWTLVSGPFKSVNDFNEALDIAEKIDRILSNSIIIKQIAFKLSKLADNQESWQKTIFWLKKVNLEDLSEDFIKNTKWSDKSQWKYNYFKALLKVGQHEEVISNIDESINKYPQIKEYFLNLKAKSFKELEKYEDSAKIYEKLMTLKKDWWIYKDYADLLLKMKDKDKALKMFYHAAIANKQIKTMVNIYYSIGKLCTELGKDKEALNHFVLCKLIREREGWTVPEYIESSIKLLSNSFPDIPNINSINQIVSNCREFWKNGRLNNSEFQKTKRKKVKKFNGILSMGHQNQLYCFINTETESIICNKSILPSNIRDNDTVECEAVPSYDKKKQRESWKAIKVEKF